MRFRDLEDCIPNGGQRPLHFSVAVPHDAPVPSGVLPYVGLSSSLASSLPAAPALGVLGAAPSETPDPDLAGAFRFLSSAMSPNVGRADAFADASEAATDDFWSGRGPAVGRASSSSTERQSD